MWYVLEREEKGGAYRVLVGRLEGKGQFWKIILEWILNK
jgi:hypothetical protein